MALDGNTLGTLILDALDAYIATLLTGGMLTSPLDREAAEQAKATALVDYLEDHAEDLANLVEPFLDGSDPWTYVKLASVATATDTTPVNTALTFTPAANTTYIIEGLFLLRSDGTGSGPQPGVTWPTGYSDGAVVLNGPAGTTSSETNLRIQAGTTGVLAVPGVPTTSDSWVATLNGMLIMGASPSGSFTVTIQSESTIDAHMRAGSWIRYRTI